MEAVIALGITFILAGGLHVVIYERHKRDTKDIGALLNNIKQALVQDDPDFQHVEETFLRLYHHRGIGAYYRHDFHEALDLLRVDANRKRGKLIEDRLQTSDFIFKKDTAYGEGTYFVLSEKGQWVITFSESLTFFDEQLPLPKDITIASMFQLSSGEQ